MESLEYARDAVLSLAESDSSDICLFDEYLDKSVISPIARVSSFPIHRFDDISQDYHCYLSDEREQAINLEFVATQYGVFGSYLKFSNGEQAHKQSYVISLEVINTVLELSARSRLTPAELRLAIQLVSGMELKRTAAQDNVSLETKRSQIKSIMAKLGVSRQQDVIRTILPSLTRLTDPKEWDSESPSIFIDYANKYLPDNVRSYSLTSRNNQSVRIIEYGPVTGTPVIVLHPLIFPDISDKDIAYAKAHNLRLIWPLRPGLLKSTPAQQNTRFYADETIQGIDLVWEHLCGKPVHIIAMVSSARYAVTYAQLKPNNVSGLTFAATCFSAGKYENNLICFASSVAELCSRNTWLMSQTIDFMRKKLTDINRFKATIMRIHKNSAPDLATLDKEFAEPYLGYRIKMALIESPESVKHDFFNQIHFRWSSIKNLKIPIKFVHGEFDSVHKLSDVKKLIKGNGDYPLVTLKNVGHNMQYKHFRRLISEALQIEE